MEIFIRFYKILVCLFLTLAVTACRDNGTAKTERVQDAEWNVMVCKAISFSDPMTGITTDITYSVTDTTTINQMLLSVKPGNLTLGWTIPGANGNIWLVAYENEPVLSETAAVTDAYPLPSYEGVIQVEFKFADAKKWKTITQENIGKRLAVFVNGQLMNAPQVNSEITSGSCSVSIPADKVYDYLPDLDMDKLKQ